MGKQENGTWALNREVFLDSQGQQIEPEASGSIWVSHVSSQIADATSMQELEIKQPLGSRASDLKSMLLEMKNVFMGE